MTPVEEACTLAAKLHVVGRLEELGFYYARSDPWQKREDFHLCELEDKGWSTLAHWLRIAQDAWNEKAPQMDHWVARWRIVLDDDERAQAVRYLGFDYKDHLSADGMREVKGIHRLEDLLDHSYIPLSWLRNAELWGKTVVAGIKYAEGLSSCERERILREMMEVVMT